MGIVSSTELATISASRKFGEAPVYQRKFVVQVDDPATSESLITNSCGIAFLDPHPDADFTLAYNVSVSNYGGSRWHYEVTWDYELPKLGKDNVAVNPMSRPDIWTFSTGGAAVPALTYFHGSGNGDRRVLVNSAEDFFEGAMTEESEVRVTIAGNRSVFPIGVARAITNCVNSDAFLGANPYQWKCQGITGQLATEAVGEAEVMYWQVSVELVFRSSGWRLMLPNVGYNYLDGSTKKRGYVIDADTGEKVPASNPVALNTNGSIRLDSAPDILYRRVHPEVAFQPYFGTPPF